MLNILHISPAFYPATYWGGPIYSVHGLCNALAQLPGVTLKVLTTDSAGPRRSDSVQVKSSPVRYPAGYDVVFCRRWWGASASPGMFLRLWPMIRWADVVHLTGVYSAPTIPTLIICRLLGKPVVWSPRGALQRWEGTTRPQLKRVWEWICDALLTRKRCVMHVTSEQELLDSKLRIVNAIGAVIPNGVEMPPTLSRRTWRPNGGLRLLYLGRLHPKKGIENLIEAVRLLQLPLELTILGSGDPNYVRALEKVVSNSGILSRIKFLGFADAERKHVAFQETDICVVPSYSENFGMVIAESLAHGVPVIASTGTPWSLLERNDCGLWVDNAPESLADAITRMLHLDLRRLGENGRAWMQRDFSWQSIGMELHGLYCELAKQSATE